MPKFDMGAAWDDSKVLLRSHSTLTGTIAAVFLFLPTLAVGWFGPTPIAPADGASLEQVMAAFRENAGQTVPYQLLVSIISAIGGVGILRLWLSRSGTSVGDALLFAIRMIPTMIAVQLVLGVALGLGALLLLMPGIAASGGPVGMLLVLIGLILLLGLSAYFWGRLAVVSPVIADREVRNPVTALQTGWALTRDNGWRIFLFMFLVALVIVVVAALVGGVVGAVAGTSDGIGRILTGLVQGVVAAVGGLISVAIAAATYRQLVVRDGGNVFS